VLEASRFIDGNDENKRSTAQLISGSDYLDAPLPAIQPRFLGCYEDGLGHAWRDAHPLRFFADGAATMPWLSDGIWFMTQFRRWGLLRDDPDYLDVARRVHQLDLYREAAEALGIAVPEHPMRRSRLLDGSTWDGSDPAGYARGFAIHGRSSDATALSL
jgi:nitrate/nitrite transport system substrate-binding protein